MDLGILGYTNCRTMAQDNNEGNITCEDQDSSRAGSYDNEDV